MFVFRTLSDRQGRYFFEGQCEEGKEAKPRRMLLQQTHSAVRDALQTERLRLAEYEHTITEVEKLLLL